MTNLTSLSLTDARDKLRTKAISARELTEAHLDAIDKAAPLNAFITPNENALAQADASDLRIAQGAARALDGLPIGIKDMFCTKGIPTSAGSRILEGFVPPYESTVSDNLRRAGAVVLGKLNTDEFAMGSSNETSARGAVVNPWRAQGDDTPLVPGGSSGGPAAAVAARLCLAATGTDTGGSIRQPAAFCGIVGVKPTYGRCSRFGIVAFASSLDQAGPMTRSVQDAALILREMAGHDPKDATSADTPVPDFSAACAQSLKGCRVGVLETEGVSDDIAALQTRAADWLLDAGAEIVPVALKHLTYALPAYYIIAPAEASSNLARYDGVRYGKRTEADTLDAMYAKSRGAGFGAEVKRRILIGTYALSAGYYDAYYLKAQKIRALVADDFRKAFETTDMLLSPATPRDAFPIGAQNQDPLAMYLNDVFTVPASLAGLPAISVPAGLSARGLPLGVQLCAPAFQEERLFAAAQKIEDAAEFSHTPNAWWVKK